MCLNNIFNNEIYLLEFLMKNNKRLRETLYNIQFRFSMCATNYKVSFYIESLVTIIFHYVRQLNRNIDFLQY